MRNPPEWESSAWVCQCVNVKSIMKVDLPFPLKKRWFSIAMSVNCRENHSLRVPWHYLISHLLHSGKSFTHKLSSVTFPRHFHALHPCTSFIGDYFSPEKDLPQTRKTTLLDGCYQFLPEKTHVLSVSTNIPWGFVTSHNMSTSHLWCLRLYLGLCFGTLRSPKASGTSNGGTEPSKAILGVDLPLHKPYIQHWFGATHTY